MAVGVSTTIGVHATSGTWGERKLTAEAHRYENEHGTYDEIGVSASGTCVRLYLDPENTRELYEVLGAHLAAQEAAVQAA